MKNKDYIMFCDMDGCLTNFDKRFIEIFKISIRDYEKKYGKDKLHEDLDALGSDFWSSLEWMPDGKSLWSYIVSKFEKVFILSSPGDYKDAVEGKEIFLNREMDGCWIGIFDKYKYKYIDKNKKSILIDDYKKNIDRWVQHGGIGILHTDVNSTIEKLEEILKKEV